MNCIYPSPLLRYLGEGRIRLVLPANYAIKECRKTPPLPCPAALRGVVLTKI